MHISGANWNMIEFIIFFRAMLFSISSHYFLDHMNTGRDNKILDLLSGMFLYGKVLYLLFAKSVFWSI